MNECIPGKDEMSHNMFYWEHFLYKTSEQCVLPEFWKRIPKSAFIHSRYNRDEEGQDVRRYLKLLSVENMSAPLHCVAG